MLILAGVSIQAITSDNGLFARAKQTKQASIEADMNENLNLAINDLQIEKESSATTDDITQEWADSKLREYNPKVKNEIDGENEIKTITLTKNGIAKKYKINANLIIEELDLSGNSILDTKSDKNWILNAQSNVSMSVNNEYMEFHTSSSSYCFATLMTKNKINCYGYSKIKFKVMYSGPYYGSVTFGISNSQDVDSSYRLTYLESKSVSVSNVQNSETEYSIDITDMNDEYYIGFSGYTYGFRIYEIRLTN